MPFPYNFLRLFSSSSVRSFSRNTPTVTKFSSNIRCLNLLQILPIVLKLQSTEALPRGQTRIIFETIEREGKASARSPHPLEKPDSAIQVLQLDILVLMPVPLNSFKMSSTHPEDQIHSGWNEEKQVEPLQSFYISHHL